MLFFGACVLLYYLKYSYINIVVLLWNKLHKDYKIITNLNMFENKLPDFYMKNSETEYDLPGSISLYF